VIVRKVLVHSSKTQEDDWKWEGLMSEDKKYIQKKVQGKYRRVKKQIGDNKDFDKKEFIILAIIVFIIYFLNAIFPGF